MESPHEPRPHQLAIRPQSPPVVNSGTKGYFSSGHRPRVYGRTSDLQTLDRSSINTAPPLTTSHSGYRRKKATTLESAPGRNVSSEFCHQKYFTGRNPKSFGVCGGLSAIWADRP